MGRTWVLTDLPCIPIEDVSKCLYSRDAASSICIRLLDIPRILMPCLGIRGVNADLTLHLQEPWLCVGKLGVNGCYLELRTTAAVF